MQRLSNLRLHGTLIDLPNFLMTARVGIPDLTLDLMRNELKSIDAVSVPFSVLLDKSLRASNDDQANIDIDKLFNFGQLVSVVMSSSTPGNKKGVYYVTHLGKKRVYVREFWDCIRSFRPDFFVQISDEVDCSASSSRCRSSVSRSLDWLQELRQLRQSSCSLRDTVCPKLFAAVQGGACSKARDICASYMATADDVDGFQIGGIYLGESTNERNEILSRVCEQLPESKPRLVSGNLSPLDVIDAVAKGVDLFDTSYPLTLAQNGFATVFDTEGHFTLSAFELNLRERRFKYDSSPLLHNCTCYTCRRHTRAYIYHLLDAQELLGGILLQLHNFHHFSCFFAAIRDNIRSEHFLEYREKLKKSQQVTQHD